MDVLDRKIINRLQRGFPICECPFAEVAGEIGLTEKKLINRVEKLMDSKVLSRFGPMYDAQKLGGYITLAAMCVPEREYDVVAELVNGFQEVAHNYRREHRFNMWFVIAAESVQKVTAVIDSISRQTGLYVFDFPKQEEFYVGLEFKL